MSWGDNFPVYIYNLSPIYILSVFFSVVAVILTVLYQRYERQKQFLMCPTIISAAEDLDLTEAENDEDMISPIITGEFGGVLGRIKAAKQRVIEKQLLGDHDDCLYETQKLEERTEREQLEAIWSLLKEQEDKFLVTSKEEMQQQFRLYRT